MENVYWTMKNGQKINVDTMDIQHLRNTLKLIINNKARVMGGNWDSYFNECNYLN